MLTKDFENLLMTNSESINYFFTCALSIVNQIKYHGYTLNDQKVVQKILRSLLIKLDPIFVALDDSKDLSQVSIDQIIRMRKG